MKSSTVRFYERTGLLPAKRSPGGYRTYDEEAAERSTFINTAKANGLSLDEITDREKAETPWPE